MKTKPLRWTVIVTTASHRIEKPFFTEKEARIAAARIVRERFELGCTVEVRYGSGRRDEIRVIEPIVEQEQPQ